MDFRRDALLVAQFNCAKPLKALFETLALTAIEGVFEFGRELAVFHGRRTLPRIAVSIATRSTSRCLDSAWSSLRCLQRSAV